MLNKKFVLFYAFFAVLIIVTLTISFIYIKKAEKEEKKEEAEIKEEKKIEEYVEKNKEIKTVKVKMTKSKNGEIIEMSMTDYLKGVLPSEMPPAYNIEALKAQAVVARTYAYEKINANINGTLHKDSDICDDFAHCQAFHTRDKLISIWKGRGYSDKTIKEYEKKIAEAIDYTSSVVATYNGQYIKAFFHANSGGKTEGSTEIWGKQNVPYLVPVESKGEENHRYYKSEVRISLDELEKKVNTKTETPCNLRNNSEKVKVLTYTRSGRVNSVKIGENIVEATSLRTLIGLKSTNFNVEVKENTAIFSVVGYGHGLGMSQTGANYYAKEGYTYDQIIKHYYTGVDITKIGS